MVVTKYIEVQSDPSNSECQVCITDITPKVEQQLVETGINNGTATLFVVGSTAGVSTIEFEPGVLTDFKIMWERNVSKNITYNHDRHWGDGNGYSHVRASLLGASLVVPFTDKKLTLGTWQQIVLVDFDNRPRSRQIVLQIMGE
ncbi:secondary thiamine-phosphate synthase enzyme YjbQ [Chloroflexota bacterium]